MAEFGMTPAQWRDLDGRDMLFLMESKSEQNRRVNNEHRKNATQQRANRRGGR